MIVEIEVILTKEISAAELRAERLFVQGGVFSCGVHAMKNMVRIKKEKDDVIQIPTFSESEDGLNAFRVWLIVSLFCDRAVTIDEPWMKPTELSRKYGMCG